MKKTKEVAESRKDNKYRALKYTIVAFGILALGFISGVLFGPKIFTHLNKDNSNVPPSQKSQRQGGSFKFINPLLECEYNQGMGDQNMNKIETKVKQTVDKLLRDGDASHISIYYRDLNNGPWFGVNEEENYKPASLLKVPIFIAYLKNMDNNMDMLSNTLSYKTGEFEMPEAAEGLDSLKPDEKYTLEFLLHRMIINSDNQAYTLLVNRIDTNELDTVLHDLGMTIPDTKTPENIVTAKSYASLFRVLYNSSYLSRRTSEYALKVMSFARYDKGITKELPSEITVSHKFGLRKDIDETGDIYLHDCGIVYYPEKPYLLCVMTRGKDYNRLSDVISSLSKNIYDEIKVQ